MQTRAETATETARRVEWAKRWPALADRVAELDAARRVGTLPWLASRALGRVIGARRVHFVEALGLPGGLWGAYAPFGARVVLFSRLRRSECELVTLRTAWNCRSEYEWSHHVALSRLSGFSPETVERVAQGPAAVGWSPRKRAILQAVDEIVSDRSLSSEARAELRAHLSARQIADLCLLVAHYQMLATYLKALGVTPEPGAFRVLRGSEPSGRIMPKGLEKLNKAVVNPVARLFAGKVPPWVLLTHTGRKSGREYVTPLQGYKKNALMAFPLAYGENTDWARNLLGSGRAEVLHKGARFIAVNPVVLDGVQAEEFDVSRFARAASRVVKILVVTLQRDDG